MLTVLGNFSVNKMVPVLKNWASILIILLVINIAQLIETEEKFLILIGDFNAVSG